jgi:hypothetical protein
VETKDIIRIGTASKETREPIYPPIFYDGVSFQFYHHIA